METPLLQNINVLASQLKGIGVNRAELTFQPDVYESLMDEMNLRYNNGVRSSPCGYGISGTSFVFHKQPF